MDKAFTIAVSPPHLSSANLGGKLTAADNMSSLPKTKRFSAWNLLLFLPAVALVFPGFYARETPELFGIPFFYWYQVGWILLTAIITAIVYRATPE